MSLQNQVSTAGALAPIPLFRLGSRGVAVEELQRRLQTAGFYSSEIDGLYSGQTFKAVQLLQNRFKLPPDGIADPKTWAMLVGRPQTCVSTSAASNLELALAAAPSAKPLRTVKVWWNSFIPLAKVDGPWFYECFEGDGREYSNSLSASHRTHQEIEVDVTSGRVTVNKKHIGPTREINCKTGEEIGQKTAPVSELVNLLSKVSGSSIKIEFKTEASNPIVGIVAPAIDSDVFFEIDPIKRTCTLSGTHDQFPAYEAYVAANGDNGRFVYGYNPIPLGRTITSLYRSMTLKEVTVRF